MYLAFEVVVLVSEKYFWTVLIVQKWMKSPLRSTRLVCQGLCVLQEWFPY